MKDLYIRERATPVLYWLRNNLTVILIGFIAFMVALLFVIQSLESAKRDEEAKNQAAETSKTLKAIEKLSNEIKVLSKDNKTLSKDNKVLSQRNEALNTCTIILFSSYTQNGMPVQVTDYNQCVNEFKSETPSSPQDPLASSSQSTPVPVAPAPENEPESKKKDPAPADPTTPAVPTPMPPPITGIPIIDDILHGIGL